MNIDYFNYLNEIGKGKKNIVIDKSIDLALKKLDKTSSEIIIADIGCYNGVMLNTIYEKIPKFLKKRVKLYAYDCDKEILKLGRKSYRNINFIKNDLMKNFKDKNKYDIIIISNVLHEIYSKFLPNYSKAENAIIGVLRRTCKKIKKGGHLVFMDGLLPDFKKNNESVTILVSSSELLEKLKFFSNNFFIKFSFNEIKPNLIKISLKDLSMFLSKFKYIDKNYWDLESKQIYQYFSLKKFEDLFNDLKLSIIFKSLQKNNLIKGSVKIIKPSKEKIPYKNIILICKKN